MRPEWPLGATNTQSEVETKAARVRVLLDSHGLDAIVLRKVSSFAWATAGRISFVNLASDIGEAYVLYTREGRFIVTNDIEAERLANEERLQDDRWSFVVAPWAIGLESAIVKSTTAMRVGSDLPLVNEVNLREEVTRLRASLTDDEIVRFREVCKLCCDAMTDAIRAVAPSQSEYEIAGRLSHALLSRGVWPIVTQVAVDDRIAHYRHVPPTSRTLERYVMLAVCGRRHGLVCSLTRALHFGSLPSDLARREEAVARVDAAILCAATAGAKLADVFAEAVAGYRAEGFDGEWQRHHQGGIAGYEPREFLATSTCDETLQLSHVVAFNPTITGVKSEDTALITPDGAEVLTKMLNWPARTIEHKGCVVSRPRIRVVH